MVQHALRDLEPPDHAAGESLDEMVCERGQLHGASACSMRVRTSLCGTL